MRGKNSMDSVQAQSEISSPGSTAQSLTIGEPDSHSAVPMVMKHSHSGADRYAIAPVANIERCTG